MLRVIFAELLEILKRIKIDGSQKELNNQIMKYTYLEEVNKLHMNIENNSNILEQTANLLFPLTSKIILLHNSWKLLHSQFNYYFNQLQYNIQDNSVVNDFCSITSSDGIYCWRRVNNIYSSSYVVNPGPLYTRKAALILNGIAIIPGERKVYIYKLTKGPPPTFTKLATHSHTSGDVNACFLHNYENAICVDYTGYAKKYNYQTLQQSDFYYTNTKFATGIQTKDKLVVLGTEEGGKIYILEEYGNYINSQLYLSTSAVHDIAEVRRGILMTADVESVYSHNIKDPYNILTSQQLFSGDKYYSIISLKSHEGDFAVGGIRDSGDSKGFVDIYYLSEENVLTLIKSKEAMERTNCRIFVITELGVGTIVLQGVVTVIKCVYGIMQSGLSKVLNVGLIKQLIMFLIL